MREVKNCYKAGVSAVIGVILMVAIVVAIGATVVIFVMNMEAVFPCPVENNNITHNGMVLYGKNTSFISTEYGLYEKWTITLSNDEPDNITTNLSYLFEIYPMTVNNTVTYLNDVTPPQIGQHVTMLCKKTDDDLLIVKQVTVI